MQKWIECAMLCSQATQAWVQDWEAGLSDVRLHLGIVDAGEVADAFSDAVYTRLQSAHVCLLPVCPENLSWVRSVLGRAVDAWPVPVVAVTYTLQAVALRDLIALGVADFTCVPGSSAELRVRLERVLAARWGVLSRSRTSHVTLPMTQANKVNEVGWSDRALEHPLEAGAATAPAVDRVSYAQRAHDKMISHQGTRTYVMGRLISRSAPREAEQRGWLPMARHYPRISGWRTDLTRVADSGLEAFAAATAARCALYDAPFKQAKGQLIQGFEKAYLAAVLSRYGGNVTQAAKAARKNRRAFWELVRKYHIDLARYRESAHLAPEMDGT